MRTLFLGWDVGGWNCDRNPRSRDALCLLEPDGPHLRPVGKPWHGNLRKLLTECSGRNLVDGLLGFVGARRASDEYLTIAIDASLGWPAAAVALIAQRRAEHVPTSAIANPYLFRAQERHLAVRGLRPLSVVRDMIGSQSLKAMHFVERAGLRMDGRGAWLGEGVLAIETYPSAARRDALVKELESRIASTVFAQAPEKLRTAWRSDVGDALCCAIVAALHGSARESLRPPPQESDPTEGWIWLPNSIQS